MGSRLFPARASATGLPTCVWRLLAEGCIDQAGGTPVGCDCECNGDITPTNAACPETVFSYGQGIGADAVTIFANGHEPVVGAFGSEGATALTGK